MNQSQRQRIERHLEEFATWRASGLPLRTYVQQHNEQLSVWRARLSWERRWQQMLAGTYQKPCRKSQTAFVKAVANHAGALTQRPQGQHPNPACDSVCIVLSTPTHPGLQASIHWPMDQLGISSAWLREVLA